MQSNDGFDKLAKTEEKKPEPMSILKKKGESTQTEEKEHHYKTDSKEKENEMGMEIIRGKGNTLNDRLQSVFSLRMVKTIENASQRSLTVNDKATENKEEDINIK